MRILILTQYFAPEIGGPQTRLASMAAELKRLGHDVEIVTGMPNYPRGEIFPEYRGRIYCREDFAGIVVHRVWLYAAMGGGVSRMLNYGSFAATAFFGLMRAKKPDYIFVESPPLLLSITGYVAGRLRGAPFILNVADLWPDAIVDGGFIRNRFLIRCMEALEKWSYEKAMYVNAVTEGIRDALLHGKMLPAEKVLFLPNGVDTDRFQPREADVVLRASLGLDGKRIILWAGTLGFAHGLENVMQAAKLLSGRTEIHFLFVGDGSAKSGLQAMARELALSNVTFLDSVPADRLPPYFSVAACGLASLADQPIHEGARPSKIFPVLASGKPIIFVGKGEGPRLVRQAGAGIVVAPGDPKALAEAVLRMVENPAEAQEFGRAGREFVEKNLQWSQLVDSWASSLAARGTPPEIAADLTNA
jgi:glycosyltransferase involved in cell wall biosynthesis